MMVSNKRISHHKDDPSEATGQDVLARTEEKGDVPNMPETPEQNDAYLVKTAEISMKSDVSEADAQVPTSKPLTDGDREVIEIEKAIEQDAARRHAEIAYSEKEFSPLDPKLAPAGKFPVAALGKFLLPFALAAQQMTGMPVDICATTLLAIVNVVVQGLADVLFIGSPKPISLYFLVVASSGERKTSVFNLLRSPLDHFEKIMELKLQQMFAERDEEKGGKKDEPLVADLLFSDATTPALYGVLARCLGRLGLFLDEAGAFIGGHGMKRDNHLSMLAQLSSLYDAQAVKIYRKADGRISIRGKRLGMLLMGQWDVVRGFLADPLNRGQGFLSRLLVSYPASTIGTRPLNMHPSGAEVTMTAYYDWMLDLVSRSLRLEDGSDNELKPRVLVMTEGAEQEFACYYDEVERQMGELGPDNGKLDILNKSPQSAVRLAATLQVAENPDAIELDADAMQRGIECARYYRDEALRLFSPPPASMHLVQAKMLLDCLKENDFREFTRTWCYSYGPHSLRSKRALMPVIDFLLDHGWLKDVSPPRKPRVSKEKIVYRLTIRAQQELGMLDK